MLSVTDSMQVTMETSRMCKQCVPGAPSEIFKCLGTRLSYTMNLCFQKRDHLLKVTEDQGLGTHLQTQEGGSPYSKSEMKIKLVGLAHAPYSFELMPPSNSRRL